VLLPSSPFVGFLVERAAPVALVKAGKGKVGYLTAPPDEKRILEQCLNIPLNQAWLPSL